MFQVRLYEALKDSLTGSTGIVRAIRENKSVKTYTDVLNFLATHFQLGKLNPDSSAVITTKSLDTVPQFMREGFSGNETYGYMQTLTLPSIQRPLEMPNSGRTIAEESKAA